MPFVEKPPVTFRVPEHFDRFAPPNGKLSGRIVLGKDFDSELGTGMKLYMNVGSNQGVKVGDYFRVVRTYAASLHDPIDSLSFDARTSEDTQKPEHSRGRSAAPRGRRSGGSERNPNRVVSHGRLRIGRCVCGRQRGTRRAAVISKQFRWQRGERNLPSLLLRDFCLRSRLRSLFEARLAETRVAVFASSETDRASFHRKFSAEETDFRVARNHRASDDHDDNHDSEFHVALTYSQRLAYVP
jgi:hypothetical protein